MALFSVTTCCLDTSVKRLSALYNESCVGAGASSSIRLTRMKLQETHFPPAAFGFNHPGAVVYEPIIQLGHSQLFLHGEHSLLFLRRIRPLPMGHSPCEEVGPPLLPGAQTGFKRFVACFGSVRGTALPPPEVTGLYQRSGARSETP